MNMKRFANDERAISNLIATLILIAVAVVGGAFAYTAFRDQATSTTSSADLQVQDISAVEVRGTVHLSTTVKNVGTQRLESITVLVDPTDPSTNEMPVGTLDPGQTGSKSMDNDAPLIPGQTYAVKITADTPDSDSEPNVTKTMTVRVES